MRKIAVTQRIIENDSYIEIRESLDIRYSKLIFSCGYIPLILPYEVDFEKYFSIFDIDGILLTGGNDLNSCNNSKISQKRDIYEKRLLKYCIKNNIPVFGICRGMQLISEYFGSNFKKVQDQVNIKQTLYVNDNSKYKVYLERLDQVNSFHNFGIDDLSEELLISAYNKDGVIKAIEHKKYRIFGQMWHSEREKKFINNELKLIKDFFI